MAKCRFENMAPKNQPDFLTELHFIYDALGNFKVRIETYFDSRGKFATSKISKPITPKTMRNKGNTNDRPCHD